MPQLPTITVTEAQQGAILEAYKAVFGTSTTEETVAQFKKMLANMVTAEVMAVEQRKLQIQVAEAIKGKETEVNTFMQGIS